MAKKTRHVSARAAELAHAAMNHSAVPAEPTAQAETLAVQPDNHNEAITDVIEESIVAVDPVATVDPAEPVMPETTAEPTTEPTDWAPETTAPATETASSMAAFEAGMEAIAAAQTMPASPDTGAAFDAWTGMIGEAQAAMASQPAATETQPPASTAPTEAPTRILRGKTAVTGAPTRDDLPAIKPGIKDSVGQIMDRFIKDLLDGGLVKEAEVVGTLYTRLVHSNFVSVPKDAKLMG